MLHTIDNNSRASDPGGIRLSHSKLRRFHPEIYRPHGWLALVGRLSSQQQYWQLACEEHVMHGDSRAALVVGLDPLLVAAYTDELDCVALLRFTAEVVGEHGLSLGSRLLTVNTYTQGAQLACDLENGPRTYGRYNNFNPMIAEFLSDDRDRIEQRKASIAEAEWERASNMARAYLAKHGPRARDGRPLKSLSPAR